LAFYKVDESLLNRSPSNIPSFAIKDCGNERTISAGLKTDLDDDYFVEFLSLVLSVL